jgi:hypothetical protein
VSDIFQEVDEEIRRERLRKIWERWGHYIVAAAVLVVIAIGGWRVWEWYDAKQAAEAGTAFESALSLSEAGKHDEAEAAFTKIAAEAPYGYRTLARLRLAAELALRDKPAAIRTYDGLANDTSLNQTFRDLATVRGALLSVDTAPFAELQARLEPLTASDRPFRHSARELIALSAWRAGDMGNARRWYETISNDTATPQSTRLRVEMLMAVIGAEGKG